MVKDQAETLRKKNVGMEMKVVEENTRAKGVTRVISVTSGKGGVGKTTTTVNLALSLAHRGKSVLVLDADLGLANIDVMLGVTPKYTLNDLFEGRKSLSEIIIDGPQGISIIPAASGIESICNLDSGRRVMLMEAIEEVASRYDYLFIDTAAGIGPDVMYFNSASAEIVCVVNGQPTSLTDAYALIKVLSQGYGEKNISILVNEVSNEREGETTFKRLNNAVERFLHVELKYLGSVPADSAAIEAVQNQKALVEIFPSSPASMAFAAIARRVDAEFIDLRVKGGMQFFFRQLLELSAHGS